MAFLDLAYMLSRGMIEGSSMNLLERMLIK